MRELVRDLFSFTKDEADAICITTNGWVTRGGLAVMGRGVALLASRRWPGVVEIVGRAISRNGHVVQRVTNDHKALDFGGRNHLLPWHLVSFPVKPVELKVTSPNQIVPHKRSEFYPGMVAPGWMCLADENLIRRSVAQLVMLTDEMGWKRVVLPRPGCGSGELRWEAVGALLNPKLDERFTVVSL